jgi:hypothetical protein
MPNQYIQHLQKCAKKADPVKKKKCRDSYVKKGTSIATPTKKIMTKDCNKVNEKLKDFKDDVNRKVDILGKRIKNLEFANLAGINRKVVKLKPSDLKLKSTTLRKAKPKGRIVRPTPQEIERASRQWYRGKLKPTKTRVAPLLQPEPDESYLKGIYVPVKKRVKATREKKKEKKKGPNLENLVFF